MNNKIWFKNQSGMGLYCTSCLEIQPCTNPIYGEGYVIVTLIGDEPENGGTIIGFYKTEEEAIKELNDIESIIAEHYLMIEVE